MELSQAQMLALFVKKNNNELLIGMDKRSGSESGVSGDYLKVERISGGLREGRTWKETWDRQLCRVS